jgi:hypothetical protein
MMLLNLDLIAGCLCILLSTACFAIHIMTSPKHRVWLNLPEYVRGGIFLTGTLMVFRGINFIGMSDKPIDRLGHINAEGLLPLIVLTYTLTALSVHILRQTYPSRVWDRLRFFEHRASHGVITNETLEGAVVAEIRESTGNVG